MGTKGGAGVMGWALPKPAHFLDSNGSTEGLKLLRVGLQVRPIPGGSFLNGISAAGGFIRWDGFTLLRLWWLSR